MEEHNQMKKFALLALAALIAVPASAAGVTISGYIDIGYIAAENPQGGLGVATTVAGGRAQAAGATNGTWSGNDGFTLNEVNLDLSSQLTNDISAFVSVDFVNGTAGVLDYAYVDFANPGPFDLNVRVGRIPSVIGIEQRVSESNQTKFVNLSLLSPFTVGSQDGVAIYGSFSPVNYAIALTNADNIGVTGASMGTAPLFPGNNHGVAGVAGLDNNNNFALSGRVGVVPIEGLEVGVSASTDKYVTAAGAVASTNLDASRNLLGVDASYVWGALTMKGEYINVTEKVAIPALGFSNEVRTNGYYFEGVYDLNSKVSLGVRYNRAKSEQPQTGGTQPGAVVSDYSTVGFAGVYRVADNVQLKAEYDINQEKTLSRSVIPSPNSPNKLANNVFALSLVGSF
jgi:hypothetical protein